MKKIGELIDTVSHLHFTDVLDTRLGSFTFVERSENTVYYLLSMTGPVGQRLNADSGARGTINGTNGEKRSRANCEKIPRLATNRIKSRARRHFPSSGRRPQSASGTNTDLYNL